MVELRDWQDMKVSSARLLSERTGEDVAAWNKRIADQAFADEEALRTWLKDRGVTGYPQMLLVMERFGYPDFMNAPAEKLIAGQYEGRPRLRKVFDAIVAAAARLGPMTVQARKTYVSLTTTRRTFARLMPAREAVLIGLRLDREPGGRLEPSHVHLTMPVQLRLGVLRDVNREVRGLLKQAYEGSL